MKKIVWVLGTSAAGKATFLREQARGNRSQTLIGTRNKKVGVSKQSLINLGQLDDSRTSIITEVSELLAEKDAVFIKWQYGDSLLHIPEILYKKYPDIQHRAIVLKVGEAEQIRRLRTKSWWHEVGREKDFIAKEQELVSRAIADLPENFIVSERQW
jgi:hypothetical protein